MALPELAFGVRYLPDVLRQCARGERQYCHVGDTSARPPRQCAHRLAADIPPVVVRELPVALGGVGWRVSVGALVLADWILRHRALFAGRAVLELGSGLGLTGFAAAHAGAARVCLTECLPALVRNLRWTIRANAPLPCPLESRLFDLWDGPDGARRCASHVSTEERLLDVQAGSAECERLAPGERFGVVLAAECCYEAYHASALPREIARRLQRYGRARTVVLQAVREAGFLHEGGMLARMAASARAEGLLLVLTAPRAGADPPLRVAFPPDRPAPDAAAWARGASERRAQLVMLEFSWPQGAADAGEQRAKGRSLGRSSFKLAAA